MNRELRVVVLCDRLSHYSSIVRMLEPLGYLADINTPEKPTLDYVAFRFHAAGGGFTAYLESCDMVLYLLTGDPKWLALVEEVQKLGKPFVMDFDDNPWDCSPFNPAYVHLGTKEWEAKEEKTGQVRKIWVAGQDGFDPERNRKGLAFLAQTLKGANALTVPTPRLADLLEDKNPHGFALPNCIDPAKWSPGRFPRPGFRVGWQGGASHAMDVRIVAKALGRFAQNHEDVTVVISGARYRVLDEAIPPEQLEFHDWISADAHPYKMQTLGLDLEVAPVERSRFNDGKSALKWIEAGARRVPMICSDAPPYSDVVEDGVDGVLASDDEWLDHLEALYVDKVRRKRIATAAFERVRRDFNVEKQAQQWLDVYRWVVSKGTLQKPGLYIPAGAGV